ncbi:MAG: DUF86 domain-containing protein [Nitrospira sp.]|nr:DUF86 domain-containing protein [Nitrospira sp.]
MKDDRQRLEDSLDAIERIERYAARGRTAFENDELLQTWIIHHIQIIGEASRKLSDSFRQTHPEIPWSQIAAMQNVLVHDYFRVDTEEVWMVVERDLPTFKRKIEAILRTLRST